VVVALLAKPLTCFPLKITRSDRDSRISMICTQNLYNENGIVFARHLLNHFADCASVYYSIPSFICAK
jgi:hypothetical protein